MKYKLRKLAMVLVFVPLVLFLFGFIVMTLWNMILPAVLHVSTITFWQALGILLLSKILFGGFGGGWGRGRHNWKRREFKERFQQDWRQKVEDKFAGMTPDQKEKFKQEWKSRCSGWGRKPGFEPGNSQAAASTPE